MTDFYYQLYSSRKFQSLTQTLNLLAELGYAGVEGYGGLYETVQQAGRLRADLDRAGLRMPTGHFGMAALQAQSETGLEIARTLGLSVVIVPFILPQDRPSDAPGWIGFARRLEAVAKRVREAGFVFAYHNHDFEFVPTADGALPMRLLLDHAPSAEWEMDVAWIVRGAADPMDWIAEYGDRISAVHLKDIAAPGACTDEDGWADLGHGVLDWAALIAALQSGTPMRYAVMEHDNPSDERRFATRSIATARALTEPRP